LAAGVETFVLVSTDKAVRPTNIMGASKRLAELILQALAKNRSGTRFCMVRFGNVLGSSGSVVPLFREQIRQGGPVTVTHPEITRYFMTISEAVQLVIQAGSMGEGGDVFVLDMGEPVRIADLARRMIHLSGLSIHDEEHPDGEIAIVYTGLRPGEKLYEELLIGADVTGTDHPRILRAKEAELPWTELSRVLRELETAAQEFDSDRVRALLERTVSGYRPQCEIVDPVWLNTARTAVAGAPKPTNIVPLPSKPRGED
jgi:FlaA1/EpsC-like NDP-sugar epimerase